MSTTCYFTDYWSSTFFTDEGNEWTHAQYPWGDGLQNANLRGSASSWNNFQLSPVRGGGKAAYATSTVAGPTAGVEAAYLSAIAWVTPPLAADVTISGNITFNIWAFESDLLANVAINAVVEKIGPTGTFTQILKTTRTTELGTSAAAANWAETPSSTLCHKGDRLRVRIFADDAGSNMAASYTFTEDHGAASGGVDGDSYVTFTETFSFLDTYPSTTYLYLTDTGSDINPGSAIERYLSLSRGAGVQTDVTNTAAGYADPIQMTDTAGGTAVEWYTKPLTGFTLTGAVMVWMRMVRSNTAFTGGVRAELAVCDTDGSNPVNWATNNWSLNLGGTGEQRYHWFLSGDDVSVATGQRLRLRLALDDSYQAMQTGYTVTLYYAGAADATGDSYLAFGQTITETVLAAGGPYDLEDGLSVYALEDGTLFVKES